MVLRSITDIHPLFFYFILTQSDMLAYLQNIAEARSGTFPQITFDQIKEIDVLIPSNDFLNDFLYEVLLPNYYMMFNNRREIETLTKLRDTLLPKLMSGEIDLSTINQNEQLHAEVLS
jgi:type I restriction enzyme S subunit